MCILIAYHFKYLVIIIVKNFILLYILDAYDQSVFDKINFAS